MNVDVIPTGPATTMPRIDQNPYTPTAATPASSRRPDAFAGRSVRILYFNTAIAVVSLFAYGSPFVAHHLIANSPSTFRGLLAFYFAGFLGMLVTMVVGVFQFAMLIYHVSTNSPEKCHRLIALSGVIGCIAAWFAMVALAGWVVTA